MDPKVATLPSLADSPPVQTQVNIVDTYGMLDTPSDASVATFTESSNKSTLPFYSVAEAADLREWVMPYDDY
jgi:hypothetical protein